MFAHTVHVGVYQKGFMMPATSKIEHFLAKANILKKKKKHFRNLLRKKKNIAVDKFPQTNAAKILNFFSLKVNHVNHVLFFFSCSSFFKHL